MATAKATAAKKTTTTTAKKTTTTRKAAPKKVTYEDVQYRLLDPKAYYFIEVGRSGNLTFYDEEEGVTKAIRHCPNQKSIFLEEQDQFAKLVPLAFEGGYLNVSKREPITQMFLNSHPSNKANGGFLFELINEEQEAQESLELEDLILDIKSEVRAKMKEGTDESLHLLSAVVVSLTDDLQEATRLGGEGLRRIIYGHVEDNPYRFLDENGNINIFDDSYIFRKYITLRALSEGIIKTSLDGATMMYRSTSSKITSCAIGQNITEHFIEFLGTKEGEEVLGKIVKEI